jgi:glycosyltransferase involved in cell wall biosynthesis
MEKVYLSTVTPVYQGAPFLKKLVEELNIVRTQLADGGAPLQLREAIFVDDSSVDNSAQILSEIASKYSWTRVITLSRNFGQHPATIAGILHTSGDWIATLDEDLQHRPKHLILLLLHGVKEVSDVIYAYPSAPVHQSFLRDKMSLGYKRLLGRLSGNPYVRYFNSFRMIRGSIARAAASVSWHETYFDMAISWFTDRVSVLPVPLRDKRNALGGKSSYSLMGLLQHARRMLNSSRLKPVRLGGLIGLFSLMASVVLAIYTITLRIGDPETIVVRGWASTMMVILFFFGLLSIMIGILLEHLSIVLMNTLGKPTFFVVDRNKDMLLMPMLNHEENMP